MIGEYLGGLPTPFLLQVLGYVSEAIFEVFNTLSGTLGTSRQIVFVGIVNCSCS